MKARDLRIHLSISILEIVKATELRMSMAKSKFGPELGEYHRVRKVLETKFYKFPRRVASL